MYQVIRKTNRPYRLNIEGLVMYLNSCTLISAF